VTLTWPVMKASQADPLVPRKVAVGVQVTEKLAPGVSLPV